jgi:hexokinase
LAREACHLGVCFSYQAKITPDRDGMALFFGKEVQISGCYGKLVCRELLDVFSNHGITTLRSYALVNDTVAAMLGGFSQYNGAYDGVLGFILGTGTNLCYQANSKSIPNLLPFWTAPSMVINTESGAYNGFPRGTFDLLVDKATLSPGIHLAEKMLGGVYQGTILLQLLRAASSEGLFSQEFSNRICKAKKLTSIDLSEFLLHPVGSGLLARLCSSDHDRQLLSAFVNCLLERTAKLVAITLAAPMEAEDMGKTAPALIVAEGSTFWKNDTLRSMILHQSEQLITKELGRRFTFVEAENPNLAGAALAVFQQ